jgi:hypothetical protein
MGDNAWIKQGVVFIETCMMRLVFLAFKALSGHRDGITQST